jgi:hypothetical protein
MNRLVLSFLFLSLTARAFIPPLPSILKEVFDARKSGIAAEIYLKHRIEVRPQEFVELEERVLRERNETLFIWRQVGQSAVTAARWEGQNYFFAKDRQAPIGSELPIGYLVTDSADWFRDQMTAEQFIRRDQLYQFKPGFMPQGDPQTWNLKENYLRHEDIFLARLPAGIAIAVQGLSEPTASHTVFFDQALKGILRFEWKQGDQVAAWDFDQFSGKASDGFLPRRLRFERNGTVMVQSELVGSRKLKDKQLYEFKNTWKQAMSRGYSPTNTVEGALKTLLNNR